MKTNSSLRRCFPMTLLASLVLSAPMAHAQGVLENPADAALESGIGLVSGWHCEAGVIEVEFDGGARVQAAYGTPRSDTEAVCGDSDNGFGLLFNYNLLSNGFHTVRAYADGVEFDTASFKVQTLGQEFIQGLQVEVPSFFVLGIGQEVELVWSESKQNFVIASASALDFTLEEVITALLGSWSGEWRAPGANGSMNMTLGLSGAGHVAVTSLALNGTPCGPVTAVTTPELDDLNDPLIDVIMNNGSQIALEFVATESVTALAGTVLVESGPCVEDDAVFALLKQ